MRGKGGDLRREEALVAEGAGQEEDGGAGHGLAGLCIGARVTKDGKPRIGAALVPL